MRPEVQEWLDKKIKEALAAVAAKGDKFTRLWDAVAYRMAVDNEWWGLRLNCHHAWYGGEVRLFLTEEEALKGVDYFVEHMPKEWLEQKARRGWDRDKEYLSPLAKAVMANLDKCLEGDRAAYDAIINGFRETHTSELTEADLKWARTIAEKLDEQAAEEKRVMLQHPSYLDGYKTGLEWPDKWDKHAPPGGPWVYTAKAWETGQKYLNKAKISRMENEFWRKGWVAGFSEKKRTRRSNPG